jgi:hypothetical protein
MARSIRTKLIRPGHLCRYIRSGCIRSGYIYICVCVCEETDREREWVIIYVYIYIYVCVYCVHQQYMRGEIEIYTYIIWVCVVKIGSFPCPLVCRFIYLYTCWDQLVVLWDGIQDLNWLNQWIKWWSVYIIPRPSRWTSIISASFTPCF